MTTVNMVITKDSHSMGPACGLGPGKEMLFKRRNLIYFIDPAGKTAGRSEL